MIISSTYQHFLFIYKNLVKNKIKPIVSVNFYEASYGAIIFQKTNKIVNKNTCLNFNISKHEASIKFMAIH